MNCHEFLDLISAWHDGELDPEERAAVESHLSACAACRAESDAVASREAQLRALFGGRKAAVARVVSAVEVQLAEQPVVAPRLQPRSRRRFWMVVTHLLCLAVGFLAAVLLVPSVSPKSSNHDPIVGDGTTSPAPPVATLVMATGPMEYRVGGRGAWLLCPPDFTCPADSSVRTGDESLCELKTSDDSVVRLDRTTELEFTSSRKIALRQGRLWCKSVGNERMEVRAVENGGDSIPSPFSCSGDGAAWTVRRFALTWECVSAEGDVDVSAGTEIRRLGASEAVRLTDGHGLESIHSDKVADTRWMLPLLVRHGPENPELQGHVQRLLSLLGRTKVAYLSESEIRSLGEYSAWPLLRFVESPESKQDASRRGSAIRILADVAPVAFVPDLIELLADDDPDVRSYAATALRRLTGIDQGHPPEDWKRPAAENAGALDAWRAWWKQNGERFPTAIRAQKKV